VILFLFRKNSQPIDTAHKGIFGPGTKRNMKQKDMRCEDRTTVGEKG
jgi:hypothetical protein